MRTRKSKGKRVQVVYKGLIYPPPTHITVVLYGQKEPLYTIFSVYKTVRFSLIPSSLNKKKGFFWGTRHITNLFFLHLYSANICKRLPVGGSSSRTNFSRTRFFSTPLLRDPFAGLFYQIFFYIFAGSHKKTRGRRLSAEKYTFVLSQTRWFYPWVVEGGGGCVLLTGLRRTCNRAHECNLRSALLYEEETFWYFMCLSVTRVFSFFHFFYFRYAQYWCLSLFRTYTLPCSRKEESAEDIFVNFRSTKGTSFYRIIAPPTSPINCFCMD